MDVSFNRTVYEKVSLPELAVLDVTIRKLRDMVYPGEFLRKEKGKTVVKQDDPNWRHGSVSEDYVRDATELDLAIFRVLDELQVMKAKLSK